jgi:hypothetical protein
MKPTTMNDTRPHRPPEQPSEEGDARQLSLARAEGAKYMEALRYMIEQVADTGDRKRAGDYIVGFAQEKAEGMYALSGGKLEWETPGEENCHIEIAVVDAGDHRFVPALDIHARITDRHGRTVADFDVPFLWHPGLYHYGRNVTIPESGRYDLHIHVEPPTFHRHDKVNGRRYVEPVDVTFADVELTAGRE